LIKAGNLCRGGRPARPHIQKRLIVGNKHDFYNLLFVSLKHSIFDCAGDRGRSPLQKHAICIRLILADKRNFH
jgi:hypothetical protein